jgi:hypothetical protein
MINATTAINIAITTSISAKKDHGHIIDSALQSCTWSPVCERWKARASIAEIHVAAADEGRVR